MNINNPDSPSDIDKAKLIEAKRISIMIATMFNAMKVEDGVGMVALGLLLNSTLKAKIKTEYTGDIKDLNKCVEKAGEMIEAVLKVVTKDLGRIESGKTLYELAKKGMCGVN